MTKFVMKTFTPYGQLFKKERSFKTKSGMRRSKEKQNLEYGAHLTAEAYEILEDWSRRKILCGA